MPEQSTEAATTAASPTPSPAPSPTAGPAPASRAMQQSPLTLVMTIKSPQDHEALVALLQQTQTAPGASGPIATALTKIGTVHFARFVFLDPTKLAVITTFDGSFDDYINDFVDEIGHVFDALLSHMEGAPPLPVKENRAAFLAYIRNNDIPCVPPFYSAYPALNVIKIQALAAQS